MKKLYTIGMGLSLALLASSAMGQNQQIKSIEAVSEKTVAPETISNKTSADLQKDFPTEIFWYEDFSNGFDGLDTNGTWTTALAQGSLWFQTFPVDAPNGYNPDAPLTGQPDYGDFIPNFYSGDVVQSETRDNGVMMLDVDRWNSLTTVGGTPDYTSNPVLSALVSPSIDLSNIETTNLALKFYEKLRMCCSGYTATVELSLNGGDDWIPYDVFSPYGGGNDVIEELIYIDISDAIANATTDLSDVKVRFVWAGAASAYYWFIDDVSIETLPDNNLVIGKTYYNDYQGLSYTAGDEDFLNDGVTWTEYFKELEYNRQPNYDARPFTFGAVVNNGGLLAQTDVRVHVDATLPDGSIVTDFAVSDPITLEPGEGDTIFTADVVPEMDQIGTYTFEYHVTQAEDEQIPYNNIGVSRTASINDESGDGMGLLANDLGMTSGSAYPDYGDDKIWGTPYVFGELTEADEKAITHIELVILNNTGFVESEPGNQIFFNVRIGSPLQEDPEDETTLTHVYFDTEDTVAYDDPNLAHIVLPEDIWYSDDEPETIPRISFELPSPILIEADQIYQAEFRVPNNNGTGIIWPAICVNEETFSGALYLFADGGSWSYLGESSVAIRFRTADYTGDGIDDITTEAGLTLVQNYPNPFTTYTKFQYRVKESTQVNLEIRDVTGKVVFSDDLGMAAAGVPNTYRLERGNLSPGVYTYSIVTNDNVVTRKLTVE